MRVFPPIHIGVTGHRPDKLGGYDPRAPFNMRIRGVLRETFAALLKLHDLTSSRLYTGMALGVDQWAAEVAETLELPFVAMIPFAGQENRWPPAAQDHYRELCQRAVSRRYFEARSLTRAFHKRNEAIVNTCEVLVAVWNGDGEGGTAHCVRYATSVGRRIVRIDPGRLV